MRGLPEKGEVIDAQLGLYEEQAEAWKTNHHRALDCLDLEAVLGFGLHIYRWLRQADDAWSQAVQTQAKPLRREDAEQLAHWYSWWIKPCDSLLSEIKGFEAEGYEVKEAATFRDACLHVRSALSIPLDRILGAANDTSAGRPMSVLRDALRRRLDFFSLHRSFCPSHWHSTDALSGKNCPFPATIAQYDR